MTEIFTDPLDKLRTRTSEKWRRYPDDVLPLFVAEHDFPLAQPIQDALIAAVRRSDTGYVYPDRAFPEAFAAFAGRRWGWDVDPAQIIPATDVSVAIVESLRVAIAPGDGVIITPPVYPPFFELVPEAGGTRIEVPLVDDGESWSLDLDGIDAAFTAGARAMILCNPHNPLGLPHSIEQLRALAEIAARHGATIVSDEIHGPLAQPDAVFTPFLSVSDAAREHGIAVTSPSKGWNLAGLKCALFATGSARMAEMLTKLPDATVYRASLFGRLASTVALSEGEAWLDSVLRRIRENRDLLGTLLREKLPEVGYRPPQAGYLTWLDMRGLGWGDDPSVHALEKARVALNSGPAFGTQGRGFARLNIGCSPDVLSEAIDRLAASR